MKLFWVSDDKYMFIFSTNTSVLISLDLMHVKK